MHCPFIDFWWSIWSSVFMQPPLRLFLYRLLFNCFIIMLLIIILFRSFYDFTFCTFDKGFSYEATHHRLFFACKWVCFKNITIESSAKNLILKRMNNTLQLLIFSIFTRNGLRNPDENDYSEIFSSSYIR